METMAGSAIVRMSRGIGSCVKYCRFSSGLEKVLIALPPASFCVIVYSIQ